MDNDTAQVNIEGILERNRKTDLDWTRSSGNGIQVKISSIAKLPTKFGDFNIVGFYNNLDSKEHVAITKGDVTNSHDIVVRLHSECLTGDAFGSLRCDCREQLETALANIGNLQKGIILYLRQEGRGIGLNNKIRAYQLQDTGLDTVEANLALGFRDEERDFTIAAHMLSLLDVKSIFLMTNNPKKIETLTRNGVDVRGRIPLVIPPNSNNKFYLKTKSEKSGHML